MGEDEAYEYFRGAVAYVPPVAYEAIRVCVPFLWLLPHF